MLEGFYRGVYVVYKGTHMEQLGTQGYEGT